MLASGRQPAAVVASIAGPRGDEDSELVLSSVPEIK